MPHKHTFPQPLNQTTLTKDWNTTCRVRRDNEEIELARKTALVDRERRVKQQKREIRSPSSRVVTVSPRAGVEISEITHEEYA